MFSEYSKNGYKKPVAEAGGYGIVIGKTLNNETEEEIKKKVLEIQKIMSLNH